MASGGTSRTAPAPTSTSTPDWFSVWWEHFGAGRELACLVARRDGDLVGLLPFSIEPVELGPVSLRVARLAGTDPHCIVLNLPLAGDVAAQAFREGISHLLTRCDAISFTPASERSQIPELLREACAEDDALDLMEESAGAHVMFDLPDSFDAYLASISSNQRQQFRRKRKALEARYAFECRTVLPDAKDVGEFVAFHNRQWQAAGIEGHFRDWPGSEAFYGNLADRFRSDGRMRIDSLTGDEEPLTALLSLVAGQTCHARIPARTVDPEAEDSVSGRWGRS